MPTEVPTSPGKLMPLLLILFLFSVVIGIGFSIGCAAGGDLALFLGFAAG